jgi:CheY-like chemotaxis protein
MLASSPFHPPPQNPPPRAVLYVEDNEVNALLLSTLFLRRPDLRLVVATTCEEAMAMIQGLKPCLLLLDLRLPDGHGSQLLPQLRLTADCEDVPAIAVTADGVFDIAGTGFCELWPKPLDLNRVLSRLDDLLGAMPQARVLHS